MISKQGLEQCNMPCRTLARGADFVYLRPHPALQRYISNYTITFPTVGMMSNAYTVLPHGCATLVLSADGNGAACDLFGSATKPVCVGSGANRAGVLFIVEFQPAGYYAFSQMPQKDITDLILPLAEINPEMNRAMVQQLESNSDMEHFVHEMDKLFLAHLKIDVYRPEFYAANRLIVGSGGQVSVKELAQQVHYSDRHLGRVFEECVGVGVKHFARLVRVNRALKLLQTPHHSLTQVWLGTGFYDLPHFVHDFKAICGVAPQTYRDNMSDFYSEIAKF